MYFVGATLAVLREALIGCNLSDAALRQGVAEVSAESHDCLAEQAVINAIVALLEAGALR